MSEGDTFVLLPDQTYCDTNDHEVSDNGKQNDDRRHYHPDSDHSMGEYPREMEKILRKIKKQEINKWHVNKYCYERRTNMDMTIKHLLKQPKHPNRNVPVVLKKRVQMEIPRGKVTKEETDVTPIKTITSKNKISFSKSSPVGKTAIIAPQRLYQQQEGRNSRTTDSRADFLHRPVRTICKSDIEVDQKPHVTPLSGVMANIDTMSNIIKERISGTNESKIESCPPLPSRVNVTPCNIKIILNTIAVNGLDKVNKIIKLCSDHYCYTYALQDQPPPVPPRRGYEVNGEGRVSFPHLKTLATSFCEPPHQIMHKG